MQMALEGLQNDSKHSSRPPPSDSKEPNRRIEGVLRKPQAGSQNPVLRVKL